MRHIVRDVKKLVLRSLRVLKARVVRLMSGPGIPSCVRVSTSASQLELRCRRYCRLRELESASKVIKAISR